MNADDFPYLGQVFTQPSMTVPGQSLSMREILQRFTHGLPIEGQKTSIFEEDQEPSQGINPKTLDLVDRQELMETNKQLINDIQNRQKARRKKHSDSAERDRIEKAVKQAQKDEKPPLDSA